MFRSEPRASMINGFQSHWIAGYLSQPGRMQASKAAWRRVLQEHPLKLVGSDSIINLCASNSSEQAYGEPTVAGLKRLLLQWPAECAMDTRSVFYDVGSGFGRLGAFMRLHTNASKIRGIEINECRHRNALALQSSVMRELPSVGDLDFFLGDVIPT